MRKVFLSLRKRFLYAQFNETVYVSPTYPLRSSNLKSILSSLPFFSILPLIPTPNCPHSPVSQTFAG